MTSLHLVPVSAAAIREPTSAGEATGKGRPGTLLVGMRAGAATAGRDQIPQDGSQSCCGTQQAHL